jgi:hypothetical protein
VKQVETSTGTKWVEDLEENDALWAVMRSQQKPRYLSVRKVKKGWQFAVWGKSALACRNSVSDLKRLMRSARLDRGPSTP